MKKGFLLLLVVIFAAACSPGAANPAQPNVGAGATLPGGTPSAGQQLFTSIPAFPTVTGAAVVNTPQPAAPAATQPAAQPTALPAATETSAPPTQAPATSAPAATQTTVPASPVAPAASPTSAPAAPTAAPPSVPVTGAVVIIPADQLTDFQVVDPNGFRTGEVKDLIVEQKYPDGTPSTDQGLASMVVVQADFNSDWLIPVPWKNVQVRPDLRAIVLPVSAAQLVNAPGFNEDLWPASLSPAWRTAVQDFWNNPGQPAPARNPLPSGGFGAVPDYLRASEILDVDLFTPQGVKLAEVNDLGIDWQNSQAGTDAAKIGYLILKREDVLGAGSSLIPVPWRTVPLTPGQEDIVINIPPGVLQAAPGFEEFSWPDLFSGQWKSQLESYWQPY